MNKENLLKSLSKEQVAKVRACRNSDELLALARQEGIELTDEQLESVSGGACTSETDSHNRRKIDS